MTYEVDGLKTEVHFIIQHDTNVVLSFRVTLEMIAVDCHTHTKRQDFIDGCLMVVTVMHVTTTGVWVSLT